MSGNSINPTNPSQLIIIEPIDGWVSLGLKKVWQYRELLYFLTLRHVKVRYKQSVLGILWAIIQPFFTMVVFTLFFGQLAGIPSDGIPYPIFVYTALVPWTFFAQTLQQSTESLVSNANLITKVYFPRLIIPFSIAGAYLIDFFVAFSVLIGMMIFYGILPTIYVLTLPLFIILAVVTALGVGLWLTALNAQFRDIRYVVPFVIQLWLFITPVIYPSSSLSEPWNVIYGLNPMVGVIEGFRWALLGSSGAPNATMVLSVTIALILFISGLYYFRRMEKSFADVV